MFASLLMVRTENSQAGSMLAGSFGLIPALAKRTAREAGGTGPMFSAR
jgi:hypothetical protein